MMEQRLLQYGFQAQALIILMKKFLMSNNLEQTINSGLINIENCLFLTQKDKKRNLTQEHIDQSQHLIIHLIR